MSDTALFSNASPRSIEGRDYNVREDGAWVFSREYLISRGTCCGSKCLNCPYEFSREGLDRAAMRPVVSMVPSWTETLIAARLNVVGRTRFCIHPKDAIQKIPSLGGTKTLAVDARETMARVCAASKLKPIVVLDREENPKEYMTFFNQFDCEIVTTHVSDFASLSSDLATLAQAFLTGSRDDVEGADALCRLAQRAALVADPRASHAVVPPADETAAETYYFIWKNPWMVVSDDTWIGAVLRTVFSGVRLPKSLGSKYPTIDIDEIPKGSNLLFSSEPYPFEREWASLQEMPFVKSAKSASLVDGELFSWFGIRAIRFLEERNS